jgi:hypothetical protein
MSELSNHLPCLESDRSRENCRKCGFTNCGSRISTDEKHEKEAENPGRNRTPDLMTSVRR